MKKEDRSSFVFSEMDLSKMTAPHCTYVIGVDTENPARLTYCLARTIGNSTEVLLINSLQSNYYFQQEVESLSRCFNAEVVSNPSTPIISTVAGIEEVTVKAKFLCEFLTKQAWINRVHQLLPQKESESEQWIWVDKNGNILQIGEDFEAAEKAQTYPCRVYQLQRVVMAHQIGS